jgi:hypothetical protein
MGLLVFIRGVDDGLSLGLFKAAAMTKILGRDAMRC